MEMIQLTEANLEKSAKTAASVLKKGGIVLFPTDTLYGLAVDATNMEAVDRLRELKGSERKKPLSVVLPDVRSIPYYVELHEEAKPFIERFLPGPLTLVLPSKGALPEELTLNGTLGIRIPNDLFTLALSKFFDRPYTATSANRTGLATPATVADILTHFGAGIEKIDLMIDAGKREGAVPSTVIGFNSEGVPHVLREGVIQRTQLNIQ
jgi:L-threonylcarbamoyladenylate synthase